MDEQKEPRIEKNITMYLVVGIIGLIVIYFLTTYVIPRALITITKAAPSTIVSLSGSYVLGDKLLAKADGKDSVVINVFVLDKDGKPVQGKSVSISGLNNVSPRQKSSDIEGKAVFNLTSITEGQYVIDALVDGKPMGKKVTVTFRN